MQGAVLGLPLQLISRLSGVASGLAGSTVGSVLKYGTTASLMLGSIAPYISDAVKNPEGGGSDNTTIGNALTSLVSFIDLKASGIKLLERKRMSVADIPGRQGDWIQDMGRKSTVYKIKGRFLDLDGLQPGIQNSPLSTIFQSLYGNAAIGNQYLLRTIQDLGVPIPFICRLDICEVIIVAADYDDKGGQPNYIPYDLTLLEYRRLPQAMKMGAAALASLTGRT